MSASSWSPSASPTNISTTISAAGEPRVPQRREPVADLGPLEQLMLQHIESRAMLGRMDEIVRQLLELLAKGEAPRAARRAQLADELGEATDDSRGDAAVDRPR